MCDKPVQCEVLRDVGMPPRGGCSRQERSVTMEPPRTIARVEAASPATPTEPEMRATPIESAQEGQRSIRVVVQQPTLPRYRIPVFREFASRSGIDLKIEYGEYPGLPSVKPDGFKGEYVPLKQWHVRGHEIMWHDAQWKNASRKRADVLILSWNTRYLSLVPTLLRAKLAGVPTIVWGHGVSKAESRMSYAVRAMLARLADAVVFYNNTNANQFVERGFDRRRVFVAQNALDQTIIQKARAAALADPGSLQAFRDEQELGNGPLILFVSRLDMNNRTTMLVEAAELLARERDDVRVVIVGAGEDEENLKRMIAEKQLEDVVRMPGAVYNELELAKYFLSADVFCYPRNIGLSILHAFGYGVPVVTCDDRSVQNPEIDALHDGVNGILYKDGDVGSMVEALRRVINDPALAHKMSEAAHRTAMEEFTLKRMVDGFVDAVRYCVNRKRK